MVGGDDEGVAKAEPVIGAYAQVDPPTWGPAGSGQLTKMVNQICIAGVVQGLARSGRVRRSRRPRSGLGPMRRSPKAPPSRGRWTIVGRPWRVANSSSAFAVDWMRKDLGLVLDEARSNGARAEVTRPGRSVLCRGPVDGRAPLGYLQPGGPVDAQVLAVNPAFPSGIAAQEPSATRPV